MDIPTGSIFFKNECRLIYLEIGWFASVDFWIGAGIGFILAFRTIFVTVTFPCQRYTATGSTTEMIFGTHPLRTIGRFIRSNSKNDRTLDEE